MVPLSIVVKGDAADKPVLLAALVKTGLVRNNMPSFQPANRLGYPHAFQYKPPEPQDELTRMLGMIFFS
jgi:hypothetical protein